MKRLMKTEKEESKTTAVQTRIGLEFLWKCKLNTVCISKPSNCWQPAGEERKTLKCSKLCMGGLTSQGTRPYLESITSFFDLGIGIGYSHVSHVRVPRIVIKKFCSTENLKTLQCLQLGLPKFGLLLPSLLAPWKRRLNRQ